VPLAARPEAAQEPKQSRRFQHRLVLGLMEAAVVARAGAPAGLAAALFSLRGAAHVGGLGEGCRLAAELQRPFNRHLRLPALSDNVGSRMRLQKDLLTAPGRRSTLLRGCHCRAVNTLAMHLPLLQPVMPRSLHPLRSTLAH
jgi:hypothetical protein